MKEGTALYWLPLSEHLIQLRPHLLCQWNPAVVATSGKACLFWKKLEQPDGISLRSGLTSESVLSKRRARRAFPSYPHSPLRFQRGKLRPREGEWLFRVPLLDDPDDKAGPKPSWNLTLSLFHTQHCFYPYMLLTVIKGCCCVYVGRGGRPLDPLFDTFQGTVSQNSPGKGSLLWNPGAWDYGELHWTQLSFFLFPR